VASKLGVPVVAHRVADDLGDPEGRFGGIYGVGEGGASLIRPDGIVAWRSAAAVDDPERVLAEVLERVLAR
jgi:aklavinone 12-hydroxylase